MGLDMYLRKNYYVKNWTHMTDDEKHAITVLKGGKSSSIPTDKIVSIQTEEMYWRKTNAIHQWFVDNVQEGEDDCGSYYVSEEQLQELLRLVTEVLQDHSKAPELLPTQEGFFFGTTDYEGWYYQDLEYTKKELERVLACKDDGSFEYHSSW